MAEGLLHIQVSDISSEQPKLNTFFKKITYLPLETTAHSLIGRFPKVNIIDTCVCIYSSTGIMLFDNRNGKFIRKIGTKGRGPGEYSLVVFDTAGKIIRLFPNPTDYPWL